MIESVVENWITWAKGNMPGERAESLDTLLADDVTSYHPSSSHPRKARLSPSST